MSFIITNLALLFKGNVLALKEC